MVRDLLPVVSAFLKLHRIVFAPRRVAMLLRSHPDLYSINSITDAFDQLQLPNAAVEITNEHLSSLSLPVLSVLQMNNRPEFVILTKIEKDVIYIIDENLQHRTLSKDAFQVDWQQVVIMIDAPDQKKKSFHLLQYNSSVPVLLAAGILLTVGSAGNWPQFLYNILSLAGLCISIAIFLTENGKTTFLNRFCSDGNHISCQSVLNSTGARVLGNIKLTDISLLYFATLFATGIFVPNDSTSLTLVVSTLALLIVPYSIFYQARILKKWCTLCLGIVSVLMLQAALIWINEPVFTYPSAKIIISVAAVITLLAGLGALVKQQFHTAQSATRFEEETLAFKRNYELFMASYDKQPMLQVAHFQSPVAYGNPNAPVQLIVVSNPLCEPCAETHHIITSLMQQLPGQLFVQYVFYCNPGDDKDQRTAIAGRLISLCNRLPTEQRQQLLDDWYEHHKINTAHGGITTSHVNDTDHTNKTLSLFHQFRTSLHIHMAPTVILNGKWLPAGYYPDCLPWILPYCLDRLPAVIKTNSTFFLQEKQLQW